MELSLLEFGQGSGLNRLASMKNGAHSVSLLQCLRNDTFQCSCMLCSALFLNIQSGYQEDDSRVTFLPGYQY